MNTKKELFELLDSLNIPYQKIDHEPILTMKDGDSIVKRLGVSACKCLLLKNKQNLHFLLLTEGDKKFNGKEIAKQINSTHLTFATIEEMEQLLHCYQGSVSPLGLYYDISNNVNLLIDGKLLQTEYIGCHPCDNTCSLKLRMKDLVELFLPAVHHKYRTIEII